MAICRDVAIELCVALAAADRSSVVLHHLRVGVHGGEGVSISFLPTSKLRARRRDYHSTVGPASCRLVKKLAHGAVTLAQICDGSVGSGICVKARTRSTHSKNVSFIGLYRK
jgi:hypothetical protein